MLAPIPLPTHFDSIPVPSEVADRLAWMRTRIERFQDCWNQHHAAQFVAADYELVFQTLTWVLQNQSLVSRRFLEWGCGFAAVASMASKLNLASFAIEAHPDLIQQARQTVSQWPADVELFLGNFLPEGAEDLAFDPTLPSIGHEGASPYDDWGLDIEDFGIVYSYPWPGEDEFHEDVFDRYAAIGEILVMFIGPNEMRAWVKVPTKAGR
ncbi:class I SAM-dependent methyltransferase [Stieleria sp. JC731]|uniref:class I SAM-dependent methyltransferase n=1 Tax=Pirellulaceae TaxID=2691357 RepID=UPI001E3E0363|nr:class I SAM-dependent methyltransferase [Stieleria sp. JC731]MCC9601178.1 class I SAM-dependent methyltransferase [Stieleria sp. JC731]